MVTELCNLAIKNCDCLDFPISNYSSFQDDVPVFIANLPWPGDPPIGGDTTWTSPSCLGICTSEISQQDADDCAARAALECAAGDAIPVYLNTEQVGESCCDT